MRKHYDDQRLMKIGEYCSAFEQWAQACMTDLPTDDEYKKKWRAEFRDHYSFMNLAIMKSCLLYRMIYFGEKLRTRQCSIHQGRWSGIHESPCPEGCDYTGWLPEPEDQ